MLGCSFARYRPEENFARKNTTTVCSCLPNFVLQGENCREKREFEIGGFVPPPSSVRAYAEFGIYGWKPVACTPCFSMQNFTLIVISEIGYCDFERILKFEAPVPTLGFADQGQIWRGRANKWCSLWCLQMCQISACRYVLSPLRNEKTLSRNTTIFNKFWLAYYPDKSSSILEVKGQRSRPPGTKNALSAAKPHPDIAYEGYAFAESARQQQCTRSRRAHVLAAEGWRRAAMRVGDWNYVRGSSGHSELGGGRRRLRPYGGICILQAC